MKLPQLKKKPEIKTCHDISWEDNYSWIHQGDILEVLKDNKKLTISGDTRPCENVMKFGQFSDVLLHEVFIEDEIKETNKMRTLKTLHNVKDYHTPSSIVGKIASLTRCKKLVLTHLVPTKFNEKKLKRGNLCLLLGTSAGFSIGATLFRF